MEKPALSLAAVPGRRRATIGLAQEIEKRGYPGIYLPSFGDAMGLAVALALQTERIEFGTSDRSNSPGGARPKRPSAFW